MPFGEPAIFVDVANDLQPLADELLGEVTMSGECISYITVSWA